MMKENEFQRKLKNELKERFPGCIIYKTDPKQLQGSPDLLVLYGSKWAALEVKRSEKERRKPRPNQELRVERMNEMSYASFVFPENKEEVLNDLERLFVP